ncbi:hypothetical protein ACFPM0_10515 [Pseudonocardia sulfidoxydans]|uniref:hypothetical protein n=1 Tax=Pseudonocardia sulfidoxydans TaxID=54011 RepID=UPI00361DDE5C
MATLSVTADETVLAAPEAGAPALPPPPVLHAVRASASAATATIPRRTSRVLTGRTIPMGVLRCGRRGRRATLPVHYLDITSPHAGS